MSCNCNNNNPNCETCAICTPPGVTDLPDCNPVDPCDKKLNIRCITYNGASFPCLDVTTGDDLITVLLSILNYYFPPSYCCKLEGELFYNPVSSSTTTTSTTRRPTTTSTTSTSSTTTSTTFTTTIQQTCNCYRIINFDTGKAASYTYVDCETRQTVPSSVGPDTTKYQCAVVNSIIFSPGSSVNVSSISLCGAQSCPPLTTTTTTFAPPNIQCVGANNFVIANLSSSSIINSVTAIPSFFTISTTNVNPGQVVKGTAAAFTGGYVTVNISTSGGPLCLESTINGIGFSSTVVTSSGSWNLDLVVNSPDDCIQIVLTDGPCV